MYPPSVTLKGRGRCRSNYYRSHPVPTLRTHEGVAEGRRGQASVSASAVHVP